MQITCGCHHPVARDTFIVGSSIEYCGTLVKGTTVYSRSSALSGARRKEENTYDGHDGYDDGVDAGRRAVLSGGAGGSYLAPGALAEPTADTADIIYSTVTES